MLPRFAEKVEKTSTCWLWKGARDENGYGRFRWRGSSKWAHRVAYELFFEEEPGSLVVRHTCDNPLCVNPRHLLLGTHEDNCRDMKVRGRYKNGSQRLTDEQVQQIREATGTHREIAARFGVDRSYVGQLKRGTRRK